MLIALFLATGVGLALGLFGGGGSILSVAVLSFALGMPPKAAMEASLLIIGVTSTAALIAQRGSGLLSVRTGVAFGSVGMVGAFAGGRLAVLIPEAVLLTVFGIVTLFTGVAMLRRKTGLPSTREHESARVLGLLAPALSIGIVTGMLGAGGGFLIVPALMLRARMPVKRAGATSLVATALQSFAGFAGHLGHRGSASLDWAVVLPFTLMATFGSVVGGLLAKRAPQELLRRGFAVLVLLVAILVVAQGLPQSR